jgi:hypothetical protein
VKVLYEVAWGCLLDWDAAKQGTTNELQEAVWTAVTRRDTRI